MDQTKKTESELELQKTIEELQKKIEELQEQNLYLRFSTYSYS